MSDNPKKSRKPSGRQVEALAKLLVIWPSASIKVCSRFVQETLGTKMTRAALQVAKEKTGLKVSSHTEQTQRKEAFTRLAVATYAAEGKWGSGNDLRPTIRKKLREQFNEDVNTVLLDTWIEGTLQLLHDKTTVEIIGEAMADLYALGVFEKPQHGRQHELL